MSVHKDKLQELAYEPLAVVRCMIKTLSMFQEFTCLLIEPNAGKNSTGSMACRLCSDLELF